ncbi:hypothetical protein RND81_04G011600 [Saponaria officinalis]|uniref:rRNA N-glycosylase n=1 Tax=Saponaria officinalis TaxID=3572 RepID=A0AAW1LFF5_SAPOF
MKTWIKVVVTWLIILQSLVSAYIKYDLDLRGTTKAQYSTFLKQLRDDVKDPNLHYGGTDIPVIRRPMNLPKALRVNLIGSTGTVSLAVRRTDLYVVAYLAKNNQNQFRAYFFENQITTVQLNNLFPEANGNYQTLEYRESYPQLQDKAKVTRRDAGLGVKLLAQKMENVAGKPRVIQNEAVFLLIAVQMVGEAARFKYIEDLVLDNFDKPGEVKPPVDDRVIILENNWKRISEATKISRNGTFLTPLVLSSYNATTTWTVTNVAEVNMGIFLNIAD